MMRLTVENIKDVKEMVHNGVTYSWFINMKSNRVSDSKRYINYNAAGRTIVSEYTIDRLPKTVQKFLQNRKRELWAEVDDYGFEQFIYRA